MQLRSLLLTVSAFVPLAAAFDTPGTKLRRHHTQLGVGGFIPLAIPGPPKKKGSVFTERFGFTNNAEIWNGRVAQLSFAWVYGQELFTGRSVLKGLLVDGNTFECVNFVVFTSLILTLSVAFWLEPPDQDNIDRGVYSSAASSALMQSTGTTSMKFSSTAQPSISTPPPVKQTDNVQPLKATKDRALTIPTQSSSDKEVERYQKAMADRERERRGNDISQWSVDLAELWNGRFAQEVLQGRGVIQGLEAGDPMNFVALIATFLAAATVGISFLFLSPVSKALASSLAPAEMMVTPPSPPPPTNAPQQTPPVEQQGSLSSGSYLDTL